MASLSFAPFRHGKKRFLLLCAVMMAVLALLTCAPASVTAKVTDADIQAMEEKIKKNSEAIAAYEKRIASLKNNLTSTIQIKNELDMQIKTMQDNIEDTNKLIAYYEQSVETKSGEIADMEKTYDEKYDALMDIIRVYYEDNSTNYLDMFLSVNSLGDLLTQAERIGSLLTLEQTLMEELNQQTVELRNMKATLVSNREKAEELKAQQQVAEKNLQTKLSETQKLIDSLNAQEGVAAQSLAEAQKLDKEFDAQLTALLKALEEQKKNEYVGGDLLWPVDATFQYVSSPYGWRKLFGSWDWHLGIDIIRLGYNIYGENIYAANTGTVVTATYHSSYGNYVLVDHGGGIATLYAHCSKLLVSAGDRVQRGQVIAKIGSTGNSTGNHLHFEVRVNGETVNPLKNYVSHPANLTIDDYNCSENPRSQKPTW